MPSLIRQRGQGWEFRSRNDAGEPVHETLTDLFGPWTKKKAAMVRLIYACGQANLPRGKATKAASDSKPKPALSPAEVCDLAKERYRERLKGGEITEGTAGTRMANVNMILATLGSNWSGWTPKRYWVWLFAKYDGSTRDGYNAAANVIRDIAREQSLDIPDFNNPRAKPASTPTVRRNERKRSGSKKSPDTKKPYTPEEQRRILAVCDRYDEEPFMRLMEYSCALAGHQPIDALNMLRGGFGADEGFDWDGAYGHVWYRGFRQKTDNELGNGEDGVPLPPTLAKMLLPYRKGEHGIEVPPPKEQDLYAKKKSPKMREHHQAIEDAAGVTRVFNHALGRHRKCFQNTLDVKLRVPHVIRKALMGQANAGASRDVIEEYGFAWQDELVKAVDALDAFVKGVDGGDTSEK